MISNCKRLKEDFIRLKEMAYSIRMNKDFNSVYFTKGHKKCII